MKRFLISSSDDTLNYNKTVYSLANSCNETLFVHETAKYFVKSWMASVLPKMKKVWEQWDTASDDDRVDYLGYLREALLNSDNEMLDFPDKGYTGPISTYSETMLRWLREEFGEPQLIVEPPVPRPPGQGNVDLIEITGVLENTSSFKVTMWEVKSSDNQVAASHNTKIYKQLRAYPNRLMTFANEMSYRFDGAPALKRFLRDMGSLARKRDPKVHYGVFIAYDPNVDQKNSIVPNLHCYPSNPPHPFTSGQKCHHLGLLLLPDFRSKRAEVWRSLHLKVK